MDDSSGTGNTSDTTGEDHAEGVGPTEITEESPSSESELALDRQAAKREADSGQDDA